MSDEIWRPVPGHEGYDVSSFGRVRSWHARGKLGHLRRTQPVLRPTFPNHKGYLRMTFGPKNVVVHNLVLTAFVGPRPDGMQAGHLNGIKTDNRIENLQWVSPKENARHKLVHGTGTRGERVNTAKLTEGDVVLIRRLVGFGVRRKTLERAYKMSVYAIGAIVTRKTWKHVADRSTGVGT